MIANPSFEAPGTNFWSSNGTITESLTRLLWCVRGRGLGRQLHRHRRLHHPESNVFPTSREEYWTVAVHGEGRRHLKVGFVWWDDDFAEAAVDWGTETWTARPPSYIHIVICRMPVQTYQAMLRIEVQGTAITPRQVLVERGFLKDWPYFDGGITYGARDDFSWYGGGQPSGCHLLALVQQQAGDLRSAVPPGHGRRRAADRRSRGRAGQVYQWVPAGTIVVPHIDVLYENDIQAPVTPKTAGVVLPYRVNHHRHTRCAEPLGVASVAPWSEQVVVRRSGCGRCGAWSLLVPGGQVPWVGSL